VPRSPSRSDAGPSDLESRIEARRERRRRAAARRAWACGILGGSMIVGGVLLQIGNETEGFVTFPYAGSLTIAFGSFVCWLGKPEAMAAPGGDGSR